MAEFKDSSLWVRIAFLLTLFGMFMFCFSLGYTGFGGTAHKDSVKATMVIAILGYITATFLIMLMVFLDELKDNKIAAIIFIIAAFVTALMYIICLALWDDYIKDLGGNNHRATHGITLAVFAILFVAVAGVLVILDLAGVKLPGVSPSE